MLYRGKRTYCNSANIHWASCVGIKMQRMLNKQQDSVIHPKKKMADIDGTEAWAGWVM